MILVLAGGVGAARFLEGVVQVVPPEDVTAIVNTGDDIEMHGLHISPDVDIVTYTLAGIIEESQGWGIHADTTASMDMLTRLGGDAWFKLGDQDLAVHIRRSQRLREGATLSQVSDEIRRALGVAVRILPMSDDPVRTHIRTPAGLMHFQHYLVQRHAKDQVLGVVFEGAEQAKAAPAVLEAITQADQILIAPSNPIVSVGTILAVPGIREALQNTKAPINAISPIVAGAAIKGPAAPLMHAAGYEVSALGVAHCYHGLADTLVIDKSDAALADAIRALGMRVIITDTIMRGPEEKRALALRAMLNAEY